MPDGSVIPRCGKCVLNSQSERLEKISKEMFDYFTALHVMTA
jgi:hypothetical protein